MKLSLVVLTPGKSMGKVIPICVSQFVIGRGPECQLRPASVLISKRHCALVTKGGKVFFHDFNSTNGSFINNRQVRGQIELQPGDRIKIGPLEFEVRIEGVASADQPTPFPPPKAQSKPVDDEVAALLLSLDEQTGPPGSPGVDSEGVPTGSTEMKLPVLQPTDRPPEEGDKEKTGKPPAGKPQPAKPPAGDTSTAAKSILDRYLRRPRS